MNKHTRHTVKQRGSMWCVMTLGSVIMRFHSQADAVAACARINGIECDDTAAHEALAKAGL